MNPSLAASAVLEGDVLRGCTATNIVYPTAALAFSWQQPERAIVMYGADGQTWPAVTAALKKGLMADGPVTLVLERRQEAQPGLGLATNAAGAAAAAAGERGGGSGSER